jgi:hypothetical protein
LANTRFLHRHIGSAVEKSIAGAASRLLISGLSPARRRALVSPDRRPVGASALLLGILGVASS